MSTATTVTPYASQGLGSGLNDSAIIQALVNIRQGAITQIQTEQSSLQTQVSDLGQIASDLSSVQTALDALATGNAVSSAVTSSNTAFTATAGTQAAAGEYSVQVTALATAAKARSSAFSSSSAPVTGGTLALTVQGQPYNLTITDGESLSDVAQAINGLGAPVSATILSDGTSSYLELTDTQTGYPVGGSPSDALSVTETDTGSQGQDLGLASIQSATNSGLTIDGLDVTETSNSISDVIPGVTLNLNTTETSPETLSIAASTSGTAQNLQNFVTAYNQLNADLQTQLNPSPTTNASGTTVAQPAPLSGDASITGLEQQLQQFLTTTVGGVDGFNSLASIGITPGEDGSLSIDQTVLANAVNTNPSAVNQLFAQAGSGLSAIFDGLATSYTDPAQGIFTQEESNMNSQVSQMGQQITLMQANLATYQTNLQQQFANMEQLVASAKSVGSYLTQLSDVQVADSPNSSG